VSPRPPDLWLIGPGRVGLSLLSLLRERGAVGSLTVSGRRPEPPDHALFTAEGCTYRGGLEPAPAADGVLLAVPDDSLAAVARGLARVGLPGRPPVLHLSGARGAEVLEPLRAAGSPVGSLHPLASVPDARTGPRRLEGAWFAVEGDPAARALAALLVQGVGGRVLPIAEGAKAIYHAAAVHASNHLVALLAEAEALLARAGAEAGAREALLSLAAGALENVRDLGPAGALTGPVSRGDAATVALHLDRLFAEERPLYSLLALRALEVARTRDPDLPGAGALERLLREAASGRSG
jgi:predicted short-subunit dehydrogenase-like oxidoreductase (DUF2520 family)